MRPAHRVKFGLILMFLLGSLLPIACSDGVSSIRPSPTFSIDKDLINSLVSYTQPPNTTPTYTFPKTSTTTSEFSLEIISVTSPVNAGANATLKAKTSPGAYCTITVYYKSGTSTAQGLSPQTAPSTGSLSWTWKVGTNTTPGVWSIKVTASLGGQTKTQTTSFTVR